MGISPWPRSQRARSRPRLARKHQVEHHKLVVAIDPCASCFPAVAHGGDADALLLQEAGEKIADLAIVVDDEDVWRLVHGM